MSQATPSYINKTKQTKKKGEGGEGLYISQLRNSTGQALSLTISIFVLVTSVFFAGRPSLLLLILCLGVAAGRPLL